MGKYRDKNYLPV
jgi:hypothetical protein